MTVRTGRDASGDPYSDVETAESKRRRLRRQLWRRIAIGASIGVLLAGLGTGAGLFLTRPGPPCESCVSFPPANAAMQKVMSAIAAENATVRSDTARPYVSVALLNPMTPSSGSDVTVQRMVDELRGAYFAQLVMNGPAATIGVQLLLVNEGSSAEANGGPAVRQIESMETSDHVVAVAGLGVSTSATATTAQDLARDGMPMFGAVTTADQFTGKNFPGMVQVVPNVTEQVDLLAAALKHPANAILVYDSQTSDFYTGDLRSGFGSAFASSFKGDARPFAPGPDNGEGFSVIAQEVCYQQGPPPVIFYAGREVVLGSFIQQLQAYDNCAGKDITIVTAGDADGLSPAYTAKQPNGNQVSVIYTDIVNLNNLQPEFRQPYTKDLAQIDPGATGLTDAWMVATYNAMMAAWTAIKQGYATTHPHIPGKADVLYWTNQLNSLLAPPGAVGPLQLGTDGQLTSPAIPIFEDESGRRVPLPS